MGRKSMFTAAQKRDAVMGVLTQRKTVAETCREMGISETTFARWREQALQGMEAALADKAPISLSCLDWLPTRMLMWKSADVVVVPMSGRPADRRGSASPSLPLTTSARWVPLPSRPRN